MPLTKANYNALVPRHLLASALAAPARRPHPKASPLTGGGAVSRVTGAERVGAWCSLGSTLQGHRGERPLPLGTSTALLTPPTPESPPGAGRGGRERARTSTAPRPSERPGTGLHRPAAAAQTAPHGQVGSFHKGWRRVPFAPRARVKTGNVTSRERAHAYLPEAPRLMAGPPSDENKNDFWHRGVPNEDS